MIQNLTSLAFAKKGIRLSLLKNEQRVHDYQHQGWFLLLSFVALKQDPENVYHSLTTNIEHHIQYRIDGFSQGFWETREKHRREQGLHKPVLGNVRNNEMLMLIVGGVS